MRLAEVPGVRALQAGVCRVSLALQRAVPAFVPALSPLFEAKRGRPPAKSAKGFMGGVPAVPAFSMGREVPGVDFDGDDLIGFAARLTDAALGWTGSAVCAPAQIAPRGVSPVRKSGDNGDRPSSEHEAQGLEASPLCPEKRGQSGDKSGDAAEEVREFACARCVLDPRVWSYRDELWAAYSAWARGGRLCRSRDDLEAPFLAARVAIIGMTGDLIAGVGLKEHWPETRRKGGRRP